MSYRTAQLKKSLASLFCLFLLAAYCLLLSADFSYAAINESFTFQGKIVDDDGTNLVNGDASCVSVGGADTCDFRVSLYTAVSGGTLVWQETKSNVELYDNDGIFNLFLDCGGTFSSCNQNGGPNFNSGDLFIQVEFDPDGDGDFAEGETFSPRRELSAVPYAFNSNMLDGVDGLSFLRSDASDNYTSGTLTFNASTELTLAASSILDIDGDLEIADTSITLDGGSTTFNASGILTLLSTGNINIQPDGDTDDYLYFDTTTHIPGLYWAGIAAADPGIYVAGTELGYRDEADAWVSFDSLAGGTYTAGNGLTLDGTAFELGGTLTEVTTVTHGTNDLIFNLDSTGDFHIRDGGSDFVTFSDNGSVLIESASNINAGLFQVGDNGQGFDNYLISAYGTQDADAAADTDYGMEVYVATVSDHLSDILYGMNLGISNQSSVNSIQRGVNIENYNTATNAITEALIAVDNLETTASTVTDGIIIMSSGVSGGIVDAIDVSNANLTNAINIGQNYILGDGIRQSSSSSTVWLFEETSGGNDLISITNASGVGNLSVTGDLTLMGGDITGANSSAIDLGEAVSGDISFYPNGDTDDYLYMNTASNIPGLFWEGIAGTDPGIYVSGTELGYRDESDAWVSFDSLGGGATDLDGVYDGDGDKILTIDSTTGLLFDMTTTGAFAIRDGTTAFWTFDDDSTVDVVFPAAGNLGISYSAAPTSDFLSLSNAGFGTTTDGVDGLFINFAAGNGTSVDASALHIDFDPIAGSSDDTFTGLLLDAITGTSATENGITIGTGWDTALMIEGGTIGTSLIEFGSDQTSGTILKIGAPSSTTANGFLTGIDLDFATNYGTMDEVDLVGMNITLPEFLVSDGSHTAKGLNITGGYSEFYTGDDFTWVGIDVVAPAATTGGPGLSVYGQRIQMGSFTGDSQTGLYIDMADSTSTGAINGIWINGITPGSGGTETAISIGSGWDTGIDVGSNVVLNIGNSGTDFNTSGGLTLANSLTVSSGGATVTSGGLTITAGTLAVNSDSITSDGALTINADDSVVLGGGGNTFTFDESSGPLYAGTARPNKTLTLSPEYAGAVLTAFYGAGTDTNITGTMTSDADTTQGTSIRNYYQWERTNATEHFHTIAVRVTLPSDFDGWQSTAFQVSYITESATSTNSELDVRIYNENNATIVASDNDNASTSWTTVDITGATLDDGASSEWDAAGETAVIYLRLGSQSGNWARVGDIKLNYLARF